MNSVLFLIGVLIGVPVGKFIASRISAARDRRPPRRETIAESIERQRRQKRGISAVIGKWPGDETDEQIDEAMRRES